MHRNIQRTLAIGTVIFVAIAGCGDAESDPNSAKPRAKIGVILPDSKSSARWETADRRFLEAAFKSAGVDYEIQNAHHDEAVFHAIADQMITNGVNVLMIVNLDSQTGRAVLARARAQGTATIDYDRLTLGGSASYYVSFDNIRVGELQGQGLVKCLSDIGARRPVIAELNGATTDNNAGQFKAGYDSILDPKYKSGEYIKGPDQSVPEWDNAQAAIIFERMLKSEPRIGGVLAANDGLGNAAIGVLKKHRLNGKVPVTGQDATVRGLQNVLLGDQCMTVYKAIKRQADAAARLAISLATGESPSTGQVVVDPTNGRQVPAVLLEPVAIHRQNLKDVVTDGFVTAAELCTTALAERCREVGIG